MERRPGSFIARALIAALFVLSGFASTAAAQEQTGSIQGVVKDSSGGVLPGVTVEARSPSSIGVRTSVTDAQGAYRFPALPPGTYEITATLQGFGVGTVPNAVVTLGKNLSIEVTLRPASLSESVTITGESPIIDTKASSVTASVDSQLIELIPKGRGLLTVLTQIPGTNNEGRGGGLMIDGASGSENRFLVDGVDRTNARTGAATAISGTEIVVQDFIETVQVKQSGYNAEYRAALGGVVNAVTKSGGNTFHGSGGAYYTTNKWLGEQRRTLRSVPTNAALSEYINTPRDKAYQVDYVAQLGGPILRDRAWFFVGYAPQYYPSERTVTWRTPGSNPATQTFDNGDPNNIAINYNLTAQILNPLRGRFTGSNETQKGALGLPGIEPDGTSTSNANSFNPRSSVYTQQFQNAYSGVLDWVATDRTFVNLTAGYINYGLGSEGGDYYHGTRRTFSTTNVGLAGVPESLQRVSGFADNNSNSFTETDEYERFNLSLDATRYVHWKGDHAFKIGGLYERIGNYVDLGQQHPNIAFNWGSTLVTSQNTTATGPFGYFIVSRQYTDGDIKETNLSVFAQDQWSVNSKLTVNYGLRLEHEEIPSYNPNAPGITFGWGSKIAPRAGFAYDFGGDGKTKMYGSYGVYYDTMKLDMPRGAWGGEKWISYYYTLDTPDWTSVDCSDANGATCTGGTFIQSINFRHTSNEPGSEIGAVDPNLEPTRKHEYTLGLDRELGPRMSVGVRYAHKGWDQTIDDIGVCAPGSQVCGEVYNIGNPGYGIGQHPIDGPYPDVPKVLNTYDGLEFVFRKRYADNWQATTSLLFSRLYGNYGGLASSDENGRQAPNVSRYYDSLFLSFDQTGKEAIGRLNTDRPVQFKAQGSYTMPWGTNAGLNFFAMSGLLMSSTVSYQGVPIYFNGRGDLGRTPMLNQTDLMLSHDFKLPGNTRLTLQANVNNVFDQDTVTSLAFAAYRDALVIPGFPSRPADAFFQPGGFDTVAIQASRLPASGRPSPTYGQANGFQGARSVRVMGRISF